MNITHFEANRYHVESESDPSMAYLVDLEEHGGRGECSCRHFYCKVGPAWDRKQFEIKPCKHLWAAYSEHYWRIVNL